MTDFLVNVFARAPVKGVVKTRLAADIGHVAARRVYASLLEKTARTALESGYPTIVWSDAGRWHPLLRRLGAPIRTQAPGDLGRRMHAALRWATLRADAAVVVGSDCPGLQSRHLAAARRALMDRDLVLGPAADGGYYLIGTRRPQPALFRGIPWSSRHTLGRTLQVARSHRLRVKLLPPLNDVDTLADFKACASLP